MKWALSRQHHGKRGENMADVGPTELMHNVMELDQQNFAETIRNKDKLVVVEFYLPECPHYQKMAPIYEDLSREMADEAVFTRIHARDNWDLASQYGIQGTPTFKMFCRDQLLGEVVGETSATVLRNTIKDFIRHQEACASGRNASYELDGYG